MPVLEGRSLVKRYDDRAALNAVSFVVDAGEVVAIAGTNGAGKTTLLSILAGVTKPDSGEIDSHDAALGWVPQRAATYGKLSVRENLRLFARLEKVADIGGSVERTLERIEMADRADARAEELSGGMRQRLSIGMGLIADPAVLLLDEPSAALDPLQRERLWELLGSLAAAQGVAIVFSTHSAGEVEGHATRVLVLDDGELLYDGSPGGIGPGAHFEPALVNFLRAARGGAPSSGAAQTRAPTQTQAGTRAPADPADPAVRSAPTDPTGDLPPQTQGPSR
ncbi:MAG: ABC transporter ATP-binding protein [Solirubrobacterales bacterium]